MVVEDESRVDLRSGAISPLSILSDDVHDSIERIGRGFRSLAEMCKNPEVADRFMSSIQESVLKARSGREACSTLERHIVGVCIGTASEMGENADAECGSGLSCIVTALNRVLTDMSTIRSIAIGDVWEQVRCRYGAGIATILCVLANGLRGRGRGERAADARVFSTLRVSGSFVSELRSRACACIVLSGLQRFREDLSSALEAGAAGKADEGVGLILEWRDGRGSLGSLRLGRKWWSLLLLRF
jgi:hypothetical protein